MYTVTLLPQNRALAARPGETLQALLARQGLPFHAPCGGQGKCGKCTITVDGQPALACRTPVDRDMSVVLPLPQAEAAAPLPGTRIAFDIGTTTLVCRLLSDEGRVLREASMTNPQVGFGGDAVSRIRAARAGQADALTAALRQGMEALISRVCATPEAVRWVSAVGNPAMIQLFLGLEVDNLAHPPFAALLSRGQERPCRELLPCCPQARLLTPGHASGFVGSDILAGVLACGLHKAEDLTLLVDIGTNGELVLGNRHRLLCCATAAGPALEGAGISIGMRAEPGAIDRVWAEAGQLRCGTLGQLPPRGICGSGLIAAAAAALDLGLLDRRGRLLTPDRRLHLTDSLSLDQEDIRALQLAKGAIRAGVELLLRQLELGPEAIRRVLLAGAFGSHISPASACRIGLLPQQLLGRVEAAGNTAGAGAAALASEPALLGQLDAIGARAEYLDLSTHPAFAKAFAKAMEFTQDWCRTARALGFEEALPLDPMRLQVREDVRSMCARDTCRAYGKNWMCPPHCGELDQCQARLHGFRRGVLVQTVGQLRKDIDSRGLRAAEETHLARFAQLCRAVRRVHPQALCLGTGGCRVCGECAWPEPCRLPEQAVASMEAYGLFVTQVCRDCGADYHHGERTVTYTACILY